MSMYNMLFGTTASTFFILPMLDKHPDEYPRFRDCFHSDEEHPEYKDYIHIYTRTGGGNREDYKEANDEMRAMEGFVTDYDDSFDSTYASWIFKVPEKWQADYNLILEGKLKEISEDYKKQLYKIYPKLKDKFDSIFNK